MLESTLERTCCNHAKAHGWLVRKTVWVGRRGCPDRLFAKSGRAVWVEFKKPGGKTEPWQDREIARMLEAGLEVFVVDDMQLFCDILGIDLEPTPDLFTR